MKNYLSGLGLAVGLLLLTSNANAKSWRVNSNPNAMPHFTSINDATNNLEVVSGDTLYLEPNSTFSTTTLTKRLTLIGPGYELNSNGISPVSAGEAYITELYFNTGSAKSVVLGTCFSRIGNSNSQLFEARNCKLLAGWRNSISYINGKLIGCYIIGDYNSSGGKIDLLKNSVFENNIVITSETNEYDATFLSADNNCHINNNTFIVRTKGNIINATYSTITNNIIINTIEGYEIIEGSIARPYSNNTVNFDISNDIRNNILSTTENFKNTDFPYNQYIGATEAMIFKMEGSNEAKYQLKEGSPAIGAGTGEGDCGAFGGLYPYTLSGMPKGTPYIYNAVISDRPVDGKVSVKLKAKVHNEE